MPEPTASANCLADGSPLSGSGLANDNLVRNVADMLTTLEHSSALEEAPINWMN
jgi:hypothetical protein